MKCKCDNLVYEVTFYKVIKSLAVSKWPMVTANGSLLHCGAVYSSFRFSNTAVQVHDFVFII